MTSDMFDNTFRVFLFVINICQYTVICILICYSILHGSVCQLEGNWVTRKDLYRVQQFPQS